MELIGRHDAVGAVRAALSEGRGSVVVVGAVGGGVTAVLDAVADQAVDDFDRQVMRAAGRSAESAIPHAVIRELAAREPSKGLAAQLTAIADGAATGEGATEALWAWAEGATDVIVSVDDLHLVDAASHAAIVHLARRAELTSVVVVLGTHGDAPDGITTVELGPLDVDQLITLLGGRSDVIDPGVARAIAVLADGSPLVAVEVTRALDDAQRSGTSPLPSFAVTSTPIRHAFADALVDLPDASKRALCLAAAEPSGEVRPIAAALRALDGSIDDLAPVEAAGVIDLADGVVHFDHPIRRSVAYHLLPPASRRAAHRSLAAALDRPNDAERRAAHLAAGVIEPDEVVAADLEFVAQAAERRRDRLEARRWWTAAARLSTSADAADRRSARAAATEALDADPLDALTKAERRVAAVVGSGVTNKVAAETLYVSVKTVDAHLQSIYRKLEIGSRAELAVLVTHADLAGAKAAG